MKVFFGGSTQGVYEKREDYLTIRQMVLDDGHSLTRDWIKKELEGDTLKPHAKYYDLVRKAINEADAVILDYSAWTPSIGMQLIMAMEKGVPTLLLFDSKDSKKNKTLTDEFISPKYFKYIKREVYDNKNVKDVVSDFLVWAEKNKSVVRFNLELDRELDDYLKKLAAKNNSSKAEEIRRLIQESADSSR